MRKLAFIPVALLIAAPISGCEWNGPARSSRSIATEIIHKADEVCAHRGRTANIGWIENRTDDVVVTCNDGTNHFIDG